MTRSFEAAAARLRCALASACASAVFCLADLATAQTSWVPGPTARFVEPELYGPAAWDPGRGRAVFAARTGVWDWDGRRSWLRSGAAVGFGAAAFDTLRRRLVTVSLAFGPGYFFEWDGSAWTVQRPPFLGGHGFPGVAFDEQRGRVVVYVGDGAYSPGIHEWDGNQWTHPPQVGAPAPRHAAGFAYDPQRGDVVLYGGQDSTTVFGDCWAWNGSAWTLIAANAPPGPRAAPMLAQDPFPGALVLYGGSPGVHSTWMLFGSNWINLPTAGDPGDIDGLAFCWDGQGMLLRGTDRIWRLTGLTWNALPIEVAFPTMMNNAFSFAWDVARRQAVMFAGHDYMGAPMRQTWWYDSAWHRAAPTVSPSARDGATMAWSVVDQALLLWGGSTDAGVANDTWTWDGANWTQRSPTHAPPPRYGFLVADPTGGVMLFGGVTASGNYLDDQWLWNGADWSLQSPSVRPSPRASVGAFDEARARVVLVGYSGPYFNNMLSDTWEWDGAQWHAFPASVPPRELIQLGPGTYRHETGRVAMASRASGTFFEWNGSAWNATSIQYGGGLIVSDPVRGVIIAYPDMATLAAGCHWESSDLLAHAERYGNGCANGPTPGLMALGRAEPGEAGFTLALQTFAPSAPSLLGIAFDAGNQDLGNGCTALLANAVGSSFAMSDSGGEARWTMPVPNDVHLLGLSFRAQGAVLDPPHGLLGAVTLSDGLHIAVGN